MEAVVHIGAPKTGTSSIQHFLAENAARLAEQGVLYRRTVPHRLSQYEFALSAYERLDRHLDGGDAWTRSAVGTRAEQTATCAPALAEIARYADAGLPRAIFSTEHAYAWLTDDATIAAFDAMFREVFARVGYVLYLRAPAALIPSRYSEALKNGGSLTLAEFTDAAMSHPAAPLTRTRRWAKVVGRERLSVRLFDRATLTGGDLISDFCDAAGLDPASLVRPPRVNAGLTTVGAEVMRVLNARIPERRADGSFNETRDGFLPEVLRRTADALALRLPPWQWDRVEAATADPMEKFRREFFPDRDRLFPSNTRPEPVDMVAVKEQAMAVLADLATEGRQTPMREIRAMGVAERTVQGAQRLARRIGA